jgi:hypothetical protein
MSESPAMGHDGLGRELIVLPTGDRWLEQNLLTLEHSDHPRCGPDLHAARRANAIGAPPRVRPPDTHSSTEYIAITAAAMVLAPRRLGQPQRCHRPHLRHGVRHRHYSVGRGFESVTRHRLGQGEQCEHARIERSRGLSSALHPGIRSPERRSNQFPPGRVSGRPFIGVRLRPDVVALELGRVRLASSG